MPPLLHADPTEGSASHLRGFLRDAQQAPKVFIGAVEDVAPDPLGNLVSQHRLPHHHKLRGFYPAGRSARKALHGSRASGPCRSDRLLAGRSFGTTHQPRQDLATVLIVILLPFLHSRIRQLQDRAGERIGGFLGQPCGTTLVAIRQTLLVARQS